MKRPLFLTAVLLLSPLAQAEPPEPKFLDLTLDDKVQIGYGVAIADVDGDGNPDILLADKKQFVWYRNPGGLKAGDMTAWQKYLLAENLTPKDNVCIAAQDLDGDGKCEIAVGAEWNPGDTENSGAVFYLIPPADRTQPWQPVQLAHEPTVHRMKWMKNRDGKWALFVVPLHGRGNQKGEGAGVKILSYLPPASLNDPKAQWKTTVANSIGPDLHLTHNFEPILDNQGAPTMGFYVASKEGIFAYMTPTAWDARRTIHDLDEGQDWKSMLPPGPDGAPATTKGMGEIRKCARVGGLFSLVAVEPMHGNELVDYVPEHIGGKMVFTRHVLTETLADGHALACADLLGLKEAQVVIGWRGNPTNPNPDNIGIKLFTPLDPGHAHWRETLIDKAIACEDLVIADLNGDGKPDIIGAGRATHNLKIYLNQTPAAAKVAQKADPQTAAVEK